MVQKRGGHKAQLLRSNKAKSRAEYPLSIASTFFFLSPGSDDPHIRPCFMLDEGRKIAQVPIRLIETIILSAFVFVTTALFPD
jgi:hypothetical protein